MLAWLAVPLLAASLVPSRRRGGAMVPVLMTGFALAALWHGAGTLDPRDLRDIAGHGGGDAWFIGASIGLLITSALIIPAITHPMRALFALPVVAGTCWVMHAGMGIALVAGAAVALLPWFIAEAMPAPAEREPPLRHDTNLSLLLALVVVAASWFAPIIVAWLALVTLAWHDGVRGTATSKAVLGAATLLLAIWGWLALSIAGSVTVGLARFATDAPVSPAASQLLALLAVGGLVLLAMPWTSGRVVRGSRLLVLAVAVHGMLGMATPDGTAHWQPIISSVATLAAVWAAWHRRWDLAAFALILLAATRSGSVAFAGAALVAALPAAWASLTRARVQWIASSVVLVVVVTTVLRDEVLLSLLLVLGLSAVDFRSGSRVAPAPDPAHY